MEHINSGENKQKQNHVLSGLPDAHRQAPRDPNEYAVKFLQSLDGIIKEIEKKKTELAIVAAQSMENPTASKESYVKLMETIKKEIQALESRRDNLHNEPTKH